MSTEILDLNALAPERPQARIRWKDEDGEHDEIFGLLVPEEIGTLELSKLSRLYTQHDELWEKEHRSKVEDRQLEKLSNQLTQMFIPDAPATAVAALSAVTKRSLAVRFFVGAGLATQATLGAEVVSQLTSSLPASRASTEEEPSSGSDSPDQS